MQEEIKVSHHPPVHLPPPFVLLSIHIFLTKHRSVEKRSQSSGTAQDKAGSPHPPPPHQMPDLIVHCRNCQGMGEGGRRHGKATLPIPNPCKRSWSSRANPSRQSAPSLPSGRVTGLSSRAHAPSSFQCTWGRRASLGSPEVKTRLAKRQHAGQGEPRGKWPGGARERTPLSSPCAGKAAHCLDLSCPS